MKKLGLDKIGMTITNTLGRTGLRLKKVAPDILVVVGIAGVIGATVMACRKTSELEEIIDDFNEELDEIKSEQDSAKEDGDTADNAEYPSEASERSYRASVTKAYISTGMEVIRLYGPPVALYGISVGCILKSHNILKQRNIALAAAYEVLDNTFTRYRQNVIDAHGEEEDRAMRYGFHTYTNEIEKENPETGEKTPFCERGVAYDIPDQASGYGFWFSKETAPNTFEGDPTYDLAYARGRRTQLNELFHARGHLILHEVVDAFGLDRKPEHLVTGWISGLGDDYVDLGIDGDIFARDEYGHVVLIDPDNPEERQLLRNGFWIEPNVDGLIFDKI